FLRLNEIPPAPCELTDVRRIHAAKVAEVSVGVAAPRWRGCAVARGPEAAPGAGKRLWPRPVPAGRSINPGSGLTPLRPRRAEAEGVSSRRFALADADGEDVGQAGEQEPCDDVDDVVPPEEHRRDHDVQGEERDDGPRVLER